MSGPRVSPEGLPGGEGTVRYRTVRSKRSVAFGSEYVSADDRSVVQGVSAVALDRMVRRGVAEVVKGGVPLQVLHSGWFMVTQGMTRLSPPRWLAFGLHPRFRTGPLPLIIARVVLIYVWL